MIESSPEISSRYDFSILWNARGYEHAIEVGTDLGQFAKEIMERFKGSLWCVDNYEPYDEQPWAREGDLMMFLLAMQPFHGRVKLLKTDSVSASTQIPNWYRVDVVYVDGAHTYEAAKADIAAWWTVPVGMLAGHDYDNSHPGVVRAVNEFAEQHGLVVRLTREENFPPSWYVYKQEPEFLMKQFFDTAKISNPRFRK